MELASFYDAIIGWRGAGTGHHISLPIMIIYLLFSLSFCGH